MAHIRSCASLRQLSSQRSSKTRCLMTSRALQLSLAHLWRTAHLLQADRTTALLHGTDVSTSHSLRSAAASSLRQLSSQRSSKTRCLMTSRALQLSLAHLWRTAHLLQADRTWPVLTALLHGTDVSTSHSLRSAAASRPPPRPRQTALTECNVRSERRAADSSLRSSRVDL